MFNKNLIIVKSS